MILGTSTIFSKSGHVYLPIITKMAKEALNIRSWHFHDFFISQVLESRISSFSLYQNTSNEIKKNLGTSLDNIISGNVIIQSLIFCSQIRFAQDVCRPFLRESRQRQQRQQRQALEAPRNKAAFGQTQCPWRSLGWLACCQQAPEEEFWGAPPPEHCMCIVLWINLTYWSI